MKMPAAYLRRKLAALLYGQISYKGSVIPVYETEGENVPRYIVIGDYADADASNKQGFGATATQVIEVIERGAIEKKNVDAIGEMVNNLIKPTANSFNLDGEDFSIIVGRPSINHLVEDTPSSPKIIRLILRYSLKIGHN